MHHYKNLTYDCFMILSSSCSFFSDIAFATLSMNLLNSCFTVSPSSSILHLMLAIFENTCAETNAKAHGNLGNMRNSIVYFQTGRSVVTWISVFKTPLKRLWNELWSENTNGCRQLISVTKSFKQDRIKESVRFILMRHYVKNCWATQTREKSFE